MGLGRSAQPKQWGSKTVRKNSRPSSVRKKLLPNPKSLRVVIDTREQKPLPIPNAVRKALKTGDYTIEGFENEITFERKTPGELYGICGVDRRRFEAELERMRAFIFRAIVIEGTPGSIQTAVNRTRLSYETVMKSLLSWQMEYDVHVIYAGNRKMATKIIATMLQRYAKYRQEGIQVLTGVKGWKRNR